MAGTHKVDIVIEAQNNAKKVLDSIQKSIDNLTQSVARSQAVMAQNISKVADSVESLKESFGKISTSTQQVSRDTKKMHYDWRGLVWTIVRAEIVFRAIMRIVNAVKDYFDSMLDTLDEYQMSLLQLSAIQTTLLQGTVKSKDELVRLFNRMYSINQSVYQTLLKMSAQTPLTTEQLLRLYRAWLAYGQVVDLSNEKMRKGLLAVANAIYMMSGGFQVNRQLVQETRGLITQTSLAYSDLARFIIRSGIATKEQLKDWAEQNILLEKMFEKLSGFVIASDRALETLQGLGTTLESVWKQKVIENFGRAYDSLRALLKVLTESSSTWKILGEVIRMSIIPLRVFATVIVTVSHFLSNTIYLVESLIKDLLKLGGVVSGLPLYPLLPPFVRKKWEELTKGFGKDLFSQVKNLVGSQIDYTTTLLAIWKPDLFVTPTNILDEQAKKFKDFYTLLQSFATSGSRIADEIDQNLSKIGDSFKENFGIKSLDAYVKAKDYINSLQKGISSFIGAIAKKGKEAKLPKWDYFISGLRQVATKSVDLETFVNSLKELAKTGKVSKDVLELMGQTTLAVSQKIDYLHDRQKKLADTEKNITNVVLKETKDKLNGLIGSFKLLGAEVERFGIPATTLEAKLKNVDAQFVSLQGKIQKTIRDFVSLRDSIEKASKSTKVPKDLKENLREVLPVLNNYINKLKEWLGVLPKKKGQLKEYLRESFLKETKNKVNSLMDSFKSLGTEVERFGIPATTLEAKLKNVDIKFASLQNRLTGSIAKFEDLKTSIEKASKSTEVPEELRVKLKALLPVLDKHIDKLKEWLKILPEKANKYKEYLKLIDKQRQELFELREAQAKIEEQYKTAHISAKQYYQSILENLQKQKQAYEERLQYLKKDSQEYISTEEKILQINRKIIDTQLELDKRSNKWREGLRRTLRQYKDSLEATTSAFSVASSTLTTSLHGLEDAFIAVFGDIMRGRLRSFKDYFMILVDAIIAEISRLIAKLLILKTVVPVLEEVFGVDITGKKKKKKKKSWIENVFDLSSTALKATSFVLKPKTEFPIPLFHSGFKGVSKWVSFEPFTVIPKLHSGLASDEFPAILQKGETVLPKGQSPVTIQIIDQRTNSAPPVEVSHNRVNNRDYIRIVIKSELQNLIDRGELDTIFKHTYGLNRRPY